MNDVAKWLDSGAEVREGLRLLSIYRPNPYLELMATRQPKMYGGLLVKALQEFSDVPPETFSRQRADGRSFRRDWPFLSRPDCPPELKVLAADKITAWHNYVRLHGELFGCTTPEECYGTAKNLLENFTQNRQILAEFAYYKEHGTVLGKHPIFQETRRLAAYRRMSVVRLMKEAERLKGAVWRVKSEMARGDKPHLEDARSERLRRKQAELDIVNAMIAEHDK